MIDSTGAKLTTPDGDIPHLRERKLDNLDQDKFIEVIAMDGQAFDALKVHAYLITFVAGSVIFLYEAFAIREYRDLRLASVTSFIGCVVLIYGTVTQGSILGPIGSMGFGIAIVGAFYGLYLNQRRAKKKPSKKPDQRF